MFLAVALAALIIEALFGYPQALVRRIGHPVMWIGALIAWADAHWNRASDAFSARRVRGVVLVVLLGTAVASVGLALTAAAHWALPEPFAALVLGLVASSLLAQRSLDQHVSAVASALEKEGIAGGRRAVSMIVGRDPESLDQAGVARAAIESLAENFSDGVVAPLFWLAVVGLPGMLVYKALNTADSMIGHLSERHRAFGWAAARLDDLVNLPASRLSAVWLVLAACVIPGAAPREAICAVWHGAHKHRSPNAGWPEAAMAGALGLRLAGPRVYHGQIVEDAWMGAGRAEADARDIRRALSLYRAACMVQGLVIAGLLIAVSR